MTTELAIPKRSLRSRLDDRINPIVVKELRQAVQSRFVTAALITLITIQIAAIGIYLLNSGDSLLDTDSGQHIFIMLYSVLLGVSLLFVPLYNAELTA